MSEQPMTEPKGWEELRALQERAINRMFAAKEQGVGVRLSSDEVHALCIGVLGNCAPS